MMVPMRFMGWFKPQVRFRKRESWPRVRLPRTTPMPPMTRSTMLIEEAMPEMKGPKLHQVRTESIDARQ